MNFGSFIVLIVFWYVLHELSFLLKLIYIISYSLAWLTTSLGRREIVMETFNKLYACMLVNSQVSILILKINECTNMFLKGRPEEIELTLTSPKLIFELIN